MTRSLYRRDSLFMRSVSTVVALAFTLSLAGSGFAVPQSTGSETEPVVAEAPQAPDPVVDEQPPAEPVVPEEPVVQEPPATPPEEVTEEEPVPDEVQAPKLNNESRKGAGGDVGVTAPLAVSEPAADINIVEFEGYNTAQSKWTNGNLGKDYREGDWVPYRLVLRNAGDATGTVGQMAFGLDHFDSNPNAAIMFDQTRSWGASVGLPQPVPGDSPSAPSGFFSVAPASQDVPEGGSFGSAPTLKTTIASGAFSIGPGEYAVVYFQGHLALTVYWNFIQPGTDGAGTYPGSSGHGYLQMDSGARTLPLPSVPKPGGYVKVIKFYDTNKNGVKDASETEFLSGWDMHLHGTDGFTIDIHKTTDANGEVLFGPLPDGVFSVHEDLKSGWASETNQPISATVSSGSTVTKYIGNFRPDVVKTWSLSIDTIPVGGQAYVSYLADGQSRTTTLTGSGPYTAQVSFPYGTVISGVTWYILYNGQPVALGSSSNETLTAPVTNSFTYNSSVSGMKFSDENGNGIKGTLEPGLSGWTIILKRVVGSTETTYAQTLTVAGGGFSFADVIPGTYKVYEQQQVGWFNTVAPTGSFTVENGSTVTGLNFGNLEVSASIDVVKTGPSAVHVGDVITYDFTVTNTGNYTLTGVVVTDPLMSLNYSIGTMAAGASVSFQATYTAGAEPDPLDNTALAVGYDVFTNMVSDSDDHRVDIIKPAITVVKSADHLNIVSGTEVMYTFDVTNSGEDTLTGVVLSDDHFAVAGSSIGTLAPGATVSLTATAALSVSTTNVADVLGYDELGLMVTDDDDATVFVHNPSISIVKSVEPGVVLPDGTVMYTYLVTNTGDTLLHDVAVVDNILGPIDVIPSLAPGASVPVSISATITADVTNIGTATGYYGEEDTEFYGSVSDDSSATVDVVHPAIQVVKSADRTAVLSTDVVTYTFVVENTGDVALYDVAVNDDHLGHIGDVGFLDVGDDESFEVTTTLSTSTTNTVTAGGADQWGHPVSDTDVEFVAVHAPSILVVKSASPTTVLAGAEVQYEYVVTNTGDIGLYDIEVSDDILGHVGDIASLAAGASETLYKSGNVSVDTTNVATASGHYGDVQTDFHGMVSDTDDAFVNVIAPAIEVIKSASPSPVVAGTLVTYDYLVRNIGDVDLINVSVDDDVLGHLGDIASLAVGAEATLSAQSTLTATTTNVVVVEGTDERENPVSDTDTETVVVFNPSILLEKSVSPTVVLAGDSVTYTYMVENTGDIDLHSVDVYDDKLGYIGVIESLLIGATSELTVTAPIEVDTENVGLAVGEYGVAETPFHGTVSDDDTAAVNVVNPAISVVKTASATDVLTGDAVTYFYTVENIGDVDLFNVSVVDDMLGVVGSLDSLAVGASVPFEMSTNLAEPTTNTVVASGTDEYGHQVTDEAQAFVDVFLPFTAPDVTIDKSADKTLAMAGDIVQYTLTYKNIGEGPAEEITIVDDFDERYVSVIDAAGGTVSDGKITWIDNETLNPEDSPRVIRYTVRINSDLPASVRVVRNTVVISEPLDEDPSNNTDTWEVAIEDFLPFTGGQLGLLIAAAMIVAGIGIVLRRIGRNAAS